MSPKAEISEGQKWQVLHSLDRASIFYGFDITGVVTGNRPSILISEKGVGSSKSITLYCVKEMAKKLEEAEIVKFKKNQQNNSLLEKSKKNNRNFGSKSV